MRKCTLTTKKDKMMNRIITLLCFSLLLFCGTSPAQTIHEDDIDCFMGIFRYKDSLTRQIDLTRFSDWRFNRPDSMGPRGESHKLDFGKGRRAYLSWHDQRSKIMEHCDWWPQAHRYNALRFYIMHGNNDYGRDNVLAVWETVGKDSLRYKCGQDVGHYHRVAAITFLWDGSLIVVLEGGAGDIDFVSGWYTFFYGSVSNQPCDLTPFYTSGWRWEDDDETDSYLFYEFHCPIYEVTEVREYSSVSGGRRIIDSASAEVLDLYQMAAEKLGIDTLKR